MNDGGGWGVLRGLLGPRAGFLPPLPSLYAYQNFIRIFFLPLLKAEASR